MNPAVLPCAILAIGLFSAPGFARADPFASEWATSLKSQARLIAGSEGAGVEIKLAPGSITYWRDPGDAGLPPAFDFAGSVNLAKAEAVLPAPARIKEPGGGEAFGYERGVIFPIALSPADPGKPVTLALKLNYAVCEKICVPAQAKLSLTLPLGASPFDAALKLARQAAPRSVDANAIGATLSPLDDKRWSYCLANGEGRDLFIEPPQGWWVSVKPGERPGCFALELKESPPGAASSFAARLTITGGPGPLETNVTLAPKS